MGPLHLSPTGRYLRYGDNPPHGPNLADFAAFGGPPEELRQWQALLLAAPDLLAACQEILSMWEHLRMDIPPTSAIGRVRAAIAKAQGA